MTSLWLDRRGFISHSWHRSLQTVPVRSFPLSHPGLLAPLRWAGGWERGNRRQLTYFTAFQPGGGGYQFCSPSFGQNLGIGPRQLQGYWDMWTSSLSRSKRKRGGVGENSKPCSSPQSHGFLWAGVSDDFGKTERWNSRRLYLIKRVRGCLGESAVHVLLRVK